MLENDDESYDDDDEIERLIQIELDALDENDLADVCPVESVTVDEQVCNSIITMKVLLL